MRETIGVVLGYTVLGLLGLLLFPGVPKWVYGTFIATTECHAQSIPFETEYFESTALGLGKAQVTRLGVNGERSVCSKNSEYVSDTLTKSPVKQYVDRGTYVAPGIPQYEEPEYSSCPVTTCNDNTCSYSTGRGTCSWHGGIAY
jgi:hypothetical protein